MKIGLAIFNRHPDELNVDDTHFITERHKRYCSGTYQVGCGYSLSYSLPSFVPHYQRVTRIGDIRWAIDHIKKEKKLCVYALTDKKKRRIYLFTLCWSHRSYNNDIIKIIESLVEKKKFIRSSNRRKRSNHDFWATIARCHWVCFIFCTISA